MGASGGGSDGGMVMLYIGLAVVAVVAVGLGAMVYVLRGKIRARRAEIDQRFAGKTILFRHDWANFFGRQSVGMGQVRGNGIFIVTDREVFFAMFIPARDLTIPLDDIISVETPKSFLGKSILKPLLKITFKNPDTAPEPDAVAWYIKDLETCKAVIEQRTCNHA